MGQGVRRAEGGLAEATTIRPTRPCGGVCSGGVCSGVKIQMDPKLNLFTVALDWVGPGC